MTPFEDQLKRALQRREPPKDFTDRVLARLGEPPVRPAPGKLKQFFSAISPFRLHPGLVIPVTAAFLVMTGSTVYEHRESAIRGERAKQQLLVAMQIAGSKLHRAQQRVIQFEGGMDIEQ